MPTTPASYAISPQPVSQSPDAAAMPWQPSPSLQPGLCCFSAVVPSLWLTAEKPLVGIKRGPVKTHDDFAKAGIRSHRKIERD